MNDQVDVQDMSLVFDALRGGAGPPPVPRADVDMDDIDAEINGFSIGGGSIQVALSLLKFFVGRTDRPTTHIFNPYE